MSSPSDASPFPSRFITHGSGPMWLATPSSCQTLTGYSLPVSRRIAKFAGHYRRLRSSSQADLKALETLWLSRLGRLQPPPPRGSALTHNHDRLYSQKMLDQRCVLLRIFDGTRNIIAGIIRGSADRTCLSFHNGKEGQVALYERSPVHKGSGLPRSLPSTSLRKVNVPGNTNSSLLLH